MFGHYKELRKFLQGHGELISRLEQELYKKVSKPDIVQCDGCGCLLHKDKVFKRESTVEKREIPPPPVGYSGSNPYNYRPSVQTPEEYVLEHYKCLRCQKDES